MQNYNQPQQFSNFTVLDTQKIPSGAISKKFMASVFTWMAVALGVSTIFALLFSANEDLSKLLYVVSEGRASLTGLGMIVSFSPLAFIMVISFGYNKLSSTALSALLVVFAAFMGMSLSTLFLMYTSGSIFTCFASSSAMFGVMALMGYTTEKDLTSFGSFLIMGLVGIIIASMVNMFLHSEMIAYVVSLLGVAIFLGLTAYDVQKLKRIGAGIEYEGVSAQDTRKLAIMGALSLYLDFINLFIYMLRLFGKRK